MDRRLTGLNPLAYLGVEPLSPPQMVIKPNDPTTNDGINYALGSLWVTLPSNTAPATKLWILMGLIQGSATWAEVTLTF